MTRRSLLVAVLLAALLAPAPAAAGEAPWRPHIHDAQVYAKERRGTIAFHVRTPTRAWGSRASRTFPSASVLKAMLMDAYLNQRSVRGRGLRASDRALLEPMIRRSDNATASRILGIVGTSGLRRVARRARMERFTPALPIWGNSRITPEDQTRYFLRIRSLLPARHRTYAMNLLASIVPSQRWGIGRVSLPGWRVYFKGGWGSGTGAVDHQVSLLERDEGARVAIAVMTVDQGTHAYGKETLRGIFKRLLRGLPREGAVP
jgi:hypothetical protein